MPKTMPTIATGLGPEDALEDADWGVGVDGGRVQVCGMVLERCVLWVGGPCVPRGVLEVLGAEVDNEDVELSVLEADVVLVVVVGSWLLGAAKV